MMQQTMPAKKVTVIPPLPELQPENRAKYRQLRVAAIHQTGGTGE